MKNILAAFFLLASNPCFADSYSDPFVVKGITIGTGLARIVMNVQGSAYESCATKWRYAFDPGAPGGKEMLSVLLSAKMSGAKISVQSIGCYGEYSALTHIYFCETPLCN